MYLDPSLFVETENYFFLLTPHFYSLILEFHIGIKIHDKISLGAVGSISSDIFKNSEERKIESLHWTAGGALSLLFIAWHSLLHSAILDRLFLLPLTPFCVCDAGKKECSKGGA